MILAEFYDDVNKNEGFDHVRCTARAIVINDEGKLGYLHIVGEDEFGERNHYETAGGGLEYGEGAVEAIHREILEELGYQCEILSDLGLIIDRYNVIKRITVSHYFVVRLTDKDQINRTEAEKLLIHEIVWRNTDEVLSFMEQHDNGVNHLVHQRELKALEAYENWLKIK